MKNNFIVKNMHKFNKANVHIDRKKQGTSSEEDIEEGLSELDNEKRLFEKVILTKEQIKRISDRTLARYLECDEKALKEYIDL